MICDRQKRQVGRRDIRTSLLTENVNVLVFVVRRSLMLWDLYTRKGVCVGDTDTLTPKANSAFVAPLRPTDTRRGNMQPEYSRIAGRDSCVGDVLRTRRCVGRRAQ